MWISRRRETERLIPNSFPQVELYEQALKGLDEESWVVLSNKAQASFAQPECAREKSQFFDLLNEALAYQYLAVQGHEHVRLVSAPATGRSPDISYQQNGKVRYCEVKTIGISNDEISRANSGHAYDGHIYFSLKSEFLAKLEATIRNALAQISAVSGTGLVYLVVHFDDFSLEHYARYEEQIIECLQGNFPGQEVFVRV